MYRYHRTACAKKSCSGSCQKIIAYHSEPLRSHVLLHSNANRNHCAICLQCVARLAIISSHSLPFDPTSVVISPCLILSISCQKAFAVLLSNFHHRHVRIKPKPFRDVHRSSTNCEISENSFNGMAPGATTGLIRHAQCPSR